MRVPDDFRFDASSPVGRYWLVHGVGFTVCRADGRLLGFVEHVVVDPVRGCAESLVVRRQRLFVRRRRVTIDAGAFEAVSPASQRFLVESASSGASTASQAVGALARAALRVGSAIRRAGATSVQLVGKLLRRLAAGLIVAGVVSWHGARAVARVAVSAAGRARREASQLEPWLAAHSRTPARRLEAATRVAARLLDDLPVLATALASAARRRAATRWTRRATPPHDGPPEARDPDTTERRSDADAPLGREPSGEAPLGLNQPRNERSAYDRPR